MNISVLVAMLLLQYPTVYCIHAPKLMKVGRQYRQSYCNNNQAYFIGPPCYALWIESRS